MKKNHPEKTLINVFHACAQSLNNFQSHAWQSCHNERKHSQKMPTSPYKNGERHTANETRWEGRGERGGRMN